MLRRRKKPLSRPVGRQVAVVLACALFLAGCASAVALNLPRSGPDTATCITAPPERDLVVGVALSGGGVVGRGMARHGCSAP